MVGAPSLELARNPQEAARARLFIASTCEGAVPGVLADVLADAQLMATELFTNALTHGTGIITLRVDASPDALRVEVSDESDDDPVMRMASPDDTHGRGMLIVDRLAQTWGVRRSPGGHGKLVWFCLDAAGATS